MSRVVVVGAGLAGLSAACHLRGAGHEVTVLDTEATVGGRAAWIEDAGFTFETGPTVLTMPSLVDDALAAVGSRLADRLQVRRLDPAYRSCFADGSELRTRSAHADMRTEIERFSGPADAAAFDGFVDWLTQLHDVEMPNFIDRNLDSVLDLVSRPAAAARLLRLGGFGRLGPAVARRFADERLHRAFTFQALYAGIAPSKALAIYAVITYMDSIAGVYFPVGGISRVPQVMADALVDAGATVRTSSTVTAVVRGDGGAVTGVLLEDGELVPADAVVCTRDLPLAYRDLLPDLRAPRRVRRARYAPSAVVWHLGVRGAPRPGTEHHNIHFGHEWEGAFDALIDRRELMPDPSRLVSVPSLTEAGLAPQGCTSLYVLEPVPHLDGRIDWDRERAPMKERLLEFLDAEGYPTDVVVEHMDTPADWAARGLAAGTPFALAHTFGQTGPFRPHNIDRRAPGLVFAGSATTPGVGVPMVLVSGRLAAERVEQHLRTGA